MKTTFLRLSLVVFCSALFLAAGCKQKQNDDEAIRAAVRQHLTSLGTLNLQAMDTDFTNISIQNDKATADVAFRPKTGAPAGAAMQVSYQLEKQEGNWKVIKKSTPGGMIQHPDPNANPHAQVPGDVHGKLPNFQEMLGNSNSQGGTQQPPPAQAPPPAASKP
jgi:hypothetical protein